jgi:CTP:molybdopterin cytidylyltransferase MocA
MALHAILTAGGRLPKALREFSPSPVKALLPIGGRTLLARAAEAARGCGMVGRIAAVGGDDVQQATPEGVEYVREGLDVIDNIYHGFVTLGGLENDYVIISPDLPFISAGGLAGFLAAARVKAAMAFPLVSGEDFLARFPGAPNRFERIDGGRVTMGSMIYMTGTMVLSNIPLGRDFFRYRKLPYKLAGLLGFSIIWGYLTRRLRLSQLEARASRLTGGSVRGVFVSDAGLAYDIDNRENYAYALKRLQAEGAGVR